MTVIEEFEQHFSVDNLKKIFTEHIIYSGATGIDNLDQYAFRRQADEQVEILSRKALAGTYQFTKYKLKLISKGRNKIPREISIPTVRDRIALRALCDFLTTRYAKTVDFKLPQQVIKEIKVDILSKKYDGCIKLDVANFYPSIKHNVLSSRLRSKIRNSEIMDVILSSITSPTVSLSRQSDELSIRGVPQGLAVSNILAAIYLGNIDKYLAKYPNTKCYRYVDDVLVFCDFDSAFAIVKDIKERFAKVGLRIHDPIKSPEKSSISLLNDGFDYLGYKFKGSLITARRGTIENLKASLVAIFTSHKHSKVKSEPFLLWRLNLRITGCVFENKSKGWLFFFAEINDEKLLHTLDHYVKKLCKRFDVVVTPKKFVRAFKELSHKKYETNYIPNFDNYDIEAMKQVLVNYFAFDLSKMNNQEIEFAFHKRIGKQVKDLLVDVKDFTY
jgi:retron-type reverse transcriptase